MKLLPALMLCLGLSGCLDADISMDFSDGETMQGRFEMRFARQLFDMMGKSAEAACPGGETTLTESLFTCVTHGSASIDSLLDSEAPDGLDQGDFAPTRGARFERIGDDRLRVSFDFSEMTTGREAAPDAEQMKGMEEMVRAAMAGHSFVFRIRAQKILSTSGRLSEDGREASHVIPVVVFLDEEPDFGAPFVTEIQLRESCFLGLFCD
ncbi:hypothetical protein M4578_13105 [Salipiger sp. P9]|uniref:hypothetical protein n=1 Tax=Salipiger pentaromativorans TaxID=2943193 RepID=UPI0021573946|nr:hypothetical protein [Salipiger pentaromativorans]MCR8548769.1 hypothetical protein [Salipiger pentaromativorans]